MIAGPRSRARRAAAVLACAWCTTSACDVGPPEQGAPSDRRRVLAGPMPELHEARKQIARIHAGKLALEAYPRWTLRSGSTGCPTVDDLAEHLSGRSTALDPWGHAYVVRCGPDLPPGVQGIGVLSGGPDGRTGTADDVRSWTP